MLLSMNIKKKNSKSKEKESAQLDKRGEGKTFFKIDFGNGKQNRHGKKL